MTKILKTYQIEHIVCETKASGDMSFKRQLINSFIDKGYKVNAYREDYIGTSVFLRNYIILSPDLY